MVSLFLLNPIQPERTQIADSPMASGSSPMPEPRNQSPLSILFAINRRQCQMRLQLRIKSSSACDSNRPDV